MQDLKRAKKKMVGSSNEITNIAKDIICDIPEELDRLSKKHHHNDCDCKCGCKYDCKCDSKYDCKCGSKYDCKCDEKSKCKKYEDKCEPCEVEAEECIENPCILDECCGPIEPRRFNACNSIPYAIEVDRIFDTFKFQLFTDGQAPRGRELFFDYEVIEIMGSVPRGAVVNVAIDKICFNYSEVIIKPGTVTLEDRKVTPIKEVLGEAEHVNYCPGFDYELEGDFVDTSFEYNVSGNLNLECCSQGKGERSNYKERGLRVIVRDLVLELKGRCGCTEVTVLAYPAVKNECGKLERVQAVVFDYNTLSAECCLPVNGKSATLRQEFQTALTVDCIGKTLLKADCCGRDCDYEFCVPNGIDVILCLEEVVSILVKEQIVVLGSGNQVEPRIVDTFAKVCNFDSCGARIDDTNSGCGCSR